MAKNIDELPDDIISHILSFLSVRDTLRARLSSPRWLNLPDFRSDIHLDGPSVVGRMTGKEYESPLVQSKFMKIADRFRQLWSGNRMGSLIFNFKVDNEHSGEIENWIAKAFRMKVESIEISVRSSSKQRFVFPYTAIQQDYKPHLKSLSIIHCTPSFLDLGYTRWLSKLTKLYLIDVPLDHEKMNLIFSSATNILELDLCYCGLGELRLDRGQLPHLKKLEIIEDDMIEVKLNCPTLEVFCHIGELPFLRFVHVPVLREAEIKYTSTNLCSVLFDDINVQAPSLEQLSITVDTKIRPIPPNLARHCLKSLTLVLECGSAPLSVMHLLNACPSLEELRVLFLDRDSSNRRRGYWDQRKHHNLRKVKMHYHYKKLNLNAVRKLAKNILVNAVALEEMDIDAPSQSYVIEDYRSLQLLKDKVNPTARFIVSPWSYGNPNLDSYYA